MIFRSNLFAALLILLCSNCFASSVPFTIEKGYLVVPVKIRQDVSVEMVINTGLDTSFVDMNSAKKLGFGLPNYTSVGRVTGRNDETVVFYQVSDVVLGSVKQSNLYVKVSNFSNIEENIGREIFGILGADFFQNKIVQFDFKNKKLNFLKDFDKKSYSDKAPNVHKMKLFKTNKFGKKITLPGTTKTLINGKEAKILFDTGTPFPLLIMPSLTKKAGLKKVDKNKSVIQQIDTLKLSNFEVKDFPATVFGKQTIPKMYDKGIDGVIGLGVMQNFSIVFNFDDELIVFN